MALEAEIVAILLGAAYAERKAVRGETSLDRYLIGPDEAAVAALAAQYLAALRRNLPSLVGKAASIGNVRTGPGLDPLIDAIAEGTSVEFSRSWRSGGRHRVRAALARAKDASERLELVWQEIDSWPEARVPLEAEFRARKAEAQVQRAAWRDGGIRRVRWQTVGGSCPVCKSLNGRTVRIERPFATEGNRIGQWLPRRILRNPPAHHGCDCKAVPA